MSAQGFLDIREDDTAPADTEPGVADVVALLRANLSRRPESTRFGSFPIAPGQCALVLDADPSRARAGVAVASAVTGANASTLAFVSDRWTDPASVGGLRYTEGAQVPILSSGDAYLIMETTSALYVSVPASSQYPVLVSFFAESYSAA